MAHFMRFVKKGFSAGVGNRKPALGIHACKHSAPIFSIQVQFDFAPRPPEMIHPADNRLGALLLQFDHHLQQTFEQQPG